LIFGSLALIIGESSKDLTPFLFFERDILNALRDIAGVSTLSTQPFLVNFEHVSACFGTHLSLLTMDSADLEKVPAEINRQVSFDPNYPRYIHLDLALNGDSAGMVMGHVPRFVRVERGGGAHETLPVVHIDFALEIFPPKGGEIIFAKIRELIYELSRIGVPVRWVGFDGFQSADSIQVLRQKGFTTGLISVDRSGVPYEITKSALYDGRVRIPEHQKLKRELQMLERDAKTGKVDHPVRGSKDVADALAGVVYGLTRRREIWVGHGISMNEFPRALASLL